MTVVGIMGSMYLSILKKTAMKTTLDEIVSLCKRRGFAFPGSDIYGGFANSYTYGPYGTALKRNLKDLWWKLHVEQLDNIVGIDGDIILHPRTWEASGHTATFNDLLVDNKDSKKRYRADHLIEDQTGIDVEGMTPAEVTAVMAEHEIKCPVSGSTNWTEVRHFNMMFQTEMAKTGDGAMAYLRPETAQAIFLEYKNIIDTMRVTLPFGVGQIGKAFRNEITPGNFLFRRLEFEQMEIEYFVREDAWEEAFAQWQGRIKRWCEIIGLSNERLHWAEHADEKLSHYSKRTVDVEYEFPFGKKELYGLAYRTDYDLKQHAEHSGKKLIYRDPHTNEVLVPHVIEPSFGVDRSVLALLCDAYAEETLPDGSTRTVMRLAPVVAPVKVAVFPLMKKDGLPEKAHEVVAELRALGVVEYDQSGAIGKRYRRHDEIGTPVCVTVDYDTLEDGTVTVRDRDTMAQERIALGALREHLAGKYFVTPSL